MWVCKLLGHNWAFSDYVTIEYIEFNPIEFKKEPLERKCKRCRKKDIRKPWGGIGGWTDLTEWVSIIN